MMKPLAVGMCCLMLLGLATRVGAQQTSDHELRAAPPRAGAQSPSLNSRIIFIGDSITGHHGWRSQDFWIHRIEKALKAVDPSAAPTLVSLGVWVNGRKAYAGVLTGEPNGTAQVTARLKQGWNALFFKSAHQTYFWHQKISLLPVAGDSFDDLVVSLAKP